MKPRLILVCAVLALAAACGGEENDVTTSGLPADTGVGIITVNIEEVQGIFTEGFEVGLRFETPDGEVINSVLWSDYINSLDQGDFYKSTLEQPVRAGTVVIVGEANVGIGPPPETPNINGDMRCRLEVEVPADGSIAVEVTFSNPAACLLTK
jgi:hypothetical protein